MSQSLESYALDLRGLCDIIFYTCAGETDFFFSLNPMVVVKEQRICMGFFHL